MDEFEEAWKENRHVWESTKNLAKAMYLAGQQSRQAEVDQLKGLLEKDKYAHNLYYENANLQTLVEEKDKKLNAVEQILNDLKESMISFKEMDLYDKGHRVTTEYVIADLEQALRGEHE